MNTLRLEDLNVYWFGQFHKAFQVQKWETDPWGWANHSRDIKSTDGLKEPKADSQLSVLSISWDGYHGVKLQIHLL